MSYFYVLILFVVFLLAFIRYFVGTGSHVQPLPTPVQPVFKTYGDPGNHFTVSIPSQWNTFSDYGNQQTGIGTAHEETTRMEVTNLSSGRVGLNFSVYEKAPDCQTAEKPNTTVAGIPANFNSKTYSWIINTSDSTIVLGYYYPGAGVYRGTKKIKPVSRSQMDNDQKTINDIISSLKLTTSRPLQCPTSN